jgi:hypothetical protein
MDSGSGASSVQIDLLNDHNYATWSIQVLLVLEQKRVRSIVDGLEVAPAALATSASDDVKEKYRERLILFSEHKGMARSTILLAMERRLQKKYSTVDDVVLLWGQNKTNNTAKIKRDKWSLRSDLAAVRLGDSVDTYVDKIQNIVDDFNLVSSTDQIFKQRTCILYSPRSFCGGGLEYVWTASPRANGNG